MRMRYVPPFFIGLEGRKLYVLQLKIGRRIYLQDKHRQTECCYELINAKFFHGAFFARCVYSATHIDCKIEYAYLSSYQQLSIA